MTLQAQPKVAGVAEAIEASIEEPGMTFNDLQTGRDQEQYCHV